MKKAYLIIPFVVLAFVGATVAQAGEFGATSPLNKEGQFSASIGYSYTDTKVKLDDRRVIDRGDQKLIQNQVYLEGSYGFLKNWEGYLRLGGADLKGKDAFIDSTLPGGVADFKDNMKFFGTLGFRGLFYSAPAYSVGAFLQGSWFPEYKDVDAAQSQFKVKSLYEADLGVSIQGNVGGAVLYAGPFVYLFRGKVEDTDLTVPAVLGTTKFKEKNALGGFAGARYPFGGGYYANLEGQYKSGGTFAISVGKSF